MVGVKRLPHNDASSPSKPSMLLCVAVCPLRLFLSGGVSLLLAASTRPPPPLSLGGCSSRRACSCYLLSIPLLTAKARGNPICWWEGMVWRTTDLWRGRTRSSGGIATLSAAKQSRESVIYSADPMRGARRGGQTISIRMAHNATMWCCWSAPARSPKSGRPQPGACCGAGDHS